MRKDLKRTLFKLYKQPTNVYLTIKLNNINMIILETKYKWWNNLTQEHKEYNIELNKNKIPEQYITELFNKILYIKEEIL